MDISILGDFAFALEGARVILAEAKVLRLDDAGRAFHGTTQNQIEVASPKNDGERVTVQYAFDTSIFENDTKDPIIVAKLIYRALFQYAGSAESVRAALDDGPYIGYVLAAQVHPLAVQAWTRLIQSLGAKSAAPLPLGLTIGRKTIEARESSTKAPLTVRREKKRAGKVKSKRAA